MQIDELAINQLGSAKSFLDVCQDWLLENGVSNYSLVAAVQAIAAGKPGFGGTHWFGTVSYADRVLGCAAYEQLDGLMTSDLPEGAHRLIADAIIADGFEVKKIYGPEHDSVTLARAFCRHDSRDWSITHRWDCYAAQVVKPPAAMVNGQLRRTNSGERETIEHWAEQYAEEKPAPIPVKDFLLRKMQDGDLYVWDDSGLKTMLAVSGRTPICAKISAAFTPIEFRGRGYASSAVAMLASQLLDRGHRYATLMIETDEQHLHRMYTRIGFEKQDSRQNIILTESIDADS
ncbi:MAG: GNAT family N-acetyltransferase [Woeseiaceae bacterium]|nr:GNAT family N-acetyltransferase [Woeseiaceae bacterium]